MSDKLEINEIFGPTIQGEGFAAGRHCLFVRTFGCNLRCTWCDTAKTWAVRPELAALTETGKLFKIEEQRRLMTPEEVMEALQERWDIVARPTIIVISGGEPMMQKTKLIPLTRKLFDHGNEVHIETAGTIPTMADLDVTVAQYNVSPKLDNSGNAFFKRCKPIALRSLMRTGKARFKFVLRSARDFVEVDRYVDEVDIPRQWIQVMPEGIRQIRNVRIAQEIIDGALERGYGLSFRSHILIWGAKEGV